MKIFCYPSLRCYLAIPPIIYNLSNPLPRFILPTAWENASKVIRDAWFRISSSAKNAIRSRVTRGEHCHGRRYNIETFNLLRADLSNIVKEATSYIFIKSHDQRHLRTIAYLIKRWETYGVVDVNEIDQSNKSVRILPWTVLNVAFDQIGFCQIIFLVIHSNINSCNRCWNQTYRY